MDVHMILLTKRKIRPPWSDRRLRSLPQNWGLGGDCPQTTLRAFHMANLPLGDVTNPLGFGLPPPPSFPAASSLATQVRGRYLQICCTMNHFKSTKTTGL